MKDILLALLLGAALDLLLGDPAWLYHPVRIIGRFISVMEGRLRRRGGNLRRGAVMLTASTVAATMACVGLIVTALSAIGRVPCVIGMALLDWMGIAMTSMAQEAVGVKDALQVSLEAGRSQVSRIVGRDTQSLSREEVIKAAIETVAENTADGIISPLFYGAIGGPVLMWGFKAASTLDSMVGYMDDKYRDIGWSSARLDDVLNYIPARLTALLMCLGAWLTGQDGGNAWRIVRRDHANHLSPNCAWPESAAAGALHLRLGGDHTYFGKLVKKPTIGDDDRPAELRDIDQVNALMYAAAALMLALTVIIGIILF